MEYSEHGYSWTDCFARKDLLEVSGEKSPPIPSKYFQKGARLEGVGNNQ